MIKGGETQLWELVTFQWVRDALAFPVKSDIIYE